VLGKRGDPFGPLWPPEEVDQFRQCEAHLGLRTVDEVDQLRASRCATPLEDHVVPDLYVDESSENALCLPESAHSWPRPEIAKLLEIGFRQLSTKVIPLHIVPHNGPGTPPQPPGHVPIEEEAGREQEAA